MALDESSTAPMSPPSLPPSPLSPTRVAVEIGVIIATGVALRALSATLVVAGLGRESNSSVALASFLDLRLILWAALMVAVEVWLRCAPLGRRIRFLVLATLVTAVVGLVVSLVIARITDPGSFVALLVAAVANAVGFALCGTVAGLAIPPLLAPRAQRDGRPLRAAGIVIGTLLVAGFALMVSLIVQAFSLSFSIEGSPPSPTPDQVSRLHLTAWLAIGLLLAATAAAFVLRRRGMAITALVLFVLALALVAVLLHAPQVNEPSLPAQTGAPAPACYSGSGDCPGG